MVEPPLALSPIQRLLQYAWPVVSVILGMVTPWGGDISTGQVIATATPWGGVVPAHNTHILRDTFSHTFN